MSQINYRTINVDALDPESSTNFPMESLLPATLPQAASASDAANAATQVRQMLRGGDPEGALRTVLDTAPLGGDDRAKEVHLATVIDVLQGIRQGEMTRILEGVCSGDGGAERADCLMKYLYKGMSSATPGSGAQTPKNVVSPQNTGFSQIQARNLSEGGGGGQQMSVLLSWHERLVEIAGTGSIVRVMTDRRTV
ncbi:ARP2/3 complex 16kDa subunit (p16-Arc) [Penicillium concentricum]|uniref:Actin-related protein 2/3 complex subunit 5 n=1 Tax=Penicillium concentricum TaxID=293559 RepID=A0A9W9STX2_9EURO|nr:ARP2/3 complex 16kDa subunit (p16-Arc) [Penicillium concentricum]KAJ5384500.1 ARP2/3 complex 16kDa subunit (p16-Arc) [Penicillium concentricum]